LIVQPIIGFLSDRTWSPSFGRRKPYFLVGAILASAMLVVMPYSSTIWMAAGMLWILDASINISMEPMRAFVADILPENQLSRGYTFQSAFIGLGAVLAAVMPFVLINWFGYSKTSADGSIPGYLKATFLIGGLSFLAAMLYTIFTTKEYPPEYYDEDEEVKMGYFEGLKRAFKDMPDSFVKLAPAQFFTWMGLFLMWFYLTITITEHVFGATDPNSDVYANGLAWANICFGYYSLITFIFALFMPAISARIGNVKLHFFCLLAGGLGLLSISMVHNQYVLLLSMTGVGIAWASIVSMPYAIIAKDIPPKQMGIFMGLFNMFIVIPEIIAALGFCWVMRALLDNNKLHAVLLGGVLMIIGGLLTLRVRDDRETTANLSGK
jgi:maltose/moltooligosaccharide transporter